MTTVPLRRGRSHFDHHFDGHLRHSRLTRITSPALYLLTASCLVGAYPPPPQAPAGAQRQRRQPLVVRERVQVQSTGIAPGL